MGQRVYPVILTHWVVLFLVFVSACATQEELRKAKGEPRLENLVEVQPAMPSESLKQKELAPLLELTLPQLDLVPKKPPAKGPRFSLSAEEVDVKTILFALSKEIDQNIMIDPAISRKVTLKLSKVHKERLSQVGKNLYVACCDFKETGGKVYDLDFFMQETEGELVVTKVMIHKEDDSPRYTWFEEKGLWKTKQVD